MSETRTALPMAPTPRLDLPAPDVAGPAAVAALVADPTRAGILAVLRDGPHCVCEMAAALDERQNNVCNHLARLRDAGLVRASRHAPTPAGSTTSATTRPAAARSPRSATCSG